MSSSWNTPTSQTTHASEWIVPTSELSARPMLPATSTERPSARNISPSNAVVVVFPFVPVTATIGFERSLAPSSSSSQIGTPRARAAATSGASARTPGLLTTRSIPCVSVSSSLPTWTSTPRARSLPAAGVSSRENATTSASAASSASAADDPARARPTTRTRLPASSETLMSGMHETEKVAVEQRESRGAEDRADDPEANHDLRLGPRLHLEVVVDRRDEEHALPRSLEAHHLNDQ